MLNVRLGYSHPRPDGRPVRQPDESLIQVDCNGVDALELDVEQAEAIGFALLAVAALERGDTAAHQEYAAKSAATTVYRPAQRRIGA